MNTRTLWLVGALLMAAPWSLAAQEEDAAPAATDESALAAEAEPAADSGVEAESAAAKPPAERDVIEAPTPAVESKPVVEADESAAVTPAVEADPAIATPAPAGSPAKSEPNLESPRVIYPEDRPAWVDAPPVREGEIDRVAVSSGPHYSQGEARRQLDEAIRQAVSEYLDRHLGASHTTRYIRFRISPTHTYDERPEFSFGPMYQSHALLEFDESFRRQAERDWREALTLSRLVKTGLGVGALFFLLAVAFGYLKADNATRGYYTRRLRFGAAAAILALGAVIYFAVRAIPWL